MSTLNAKAKQTIYTKTPPKKIKYDYAKAKQTIYTKTPPKKIKYDSFKNPKKIEVDKVVKHLGRRVNSVNVSTLIKLKPKGLQIKDKDGTVVFQWKINGKIEGKGRILFEKDGSLEYI